MIKSENCELTLEGTIPDIMTDLAVITKGIKELIEKECGEFGAVIAKKLITDAVEAGFMTEDELSESIKDIKRKRKKLKSEMGAEEKKVADLFMQILKDKKV